MSAVAYEVEAMGKQTRRTTPVRLTEGAMRRARIAPGYTGESMAEYASRIVLEHGQGDAGRLHAEATRNAAKEGENTKGWLS